MNPRMMLGLDSNLGHTVRRQGLSPLCHSFLQGRKLLQLTFWHYKFCFRLAAKNIETFRPIHWVVALIFGTKCLTEYAILFSGFVHVLKTLENP